MKKQSFRNWKETYIETLKLEIELTLDLNIGLNYSTSSNSLMQTFGTVLKDNSVDIFVPERIRMKQMTECDFFDKMQFEKRKKRKFGRKYKKSKNHQDLVLPRKQIFHCKVLYTQEKKIIL